MSQSVITERAAIEQELQRRLMSRPRRITEWGSAFLARLPRVRCADGFNVSIQTGEALYCLPRSSEGPWSHVELGYPSEPMPALAQWAECEPEDASTMTDGIWPYVPLSAVARVLASHGGLQAEDANHV